MRVELLTVYSTLRRAYQPGETVDLPDADAIRLIDRELAKPVREFQTEMTVVSGGERAIVRGRSIPQSRKDRRQ